MYIEEGSSVPHKSLMKSWFQVFCKVWAFSIVRKQFGRVSGLELQVLCVFLVNHVGGRPVLVLSITLFREKSVYSRFVSVWLAVIRTVGIGVR